MPEDSRAHQRNATSELEQLRNLLAKVAVTWSVIRGAQVDMLNGRHDMDALEEIALSSNQMDDLLSAIPTQGVSS